MLVSLRKNDLDPLFKEFRVFKERHIRKNHTNFLEKPRHWPGVPGTPGQCPVKNAFFLVGFSKANKRNLGHPANRPLFVPPGVPGVPVRCPGDFLKFMCTLLS